jgi:hypothetical protein
MAVDEAKIRRLERRLVVVRVIDIMTVCALAFALRVQVTRDANRSVSARDTEGLLRAIQAVAADGHQGQP